jgi:hypothetical protein
VHKADVVPEQPFLKFISLLTAAAFNYRKSSNFSHLAREM